MSIKGATVDDYIAYLNRNFARPAKNSTLRLVNLRPKISKARTGVDIREGDMRKAITRALKRGDRGPLMLAAKVIQPSVTLRDFGPVIVIRRESKALYLYRGQRFWKKFGVATGQASCPTPVGNFEIVTMQRNPWWYPPPDSDWAQDQAYPSRPDEPARHEVDGPLGAARRDSRNAERLVDRLLGLARLHPHADPRRRVALRPRRGRDAGLHPSGVSAPAESSSDHGGLRADPRLRPLGLTVL